MSSSVADLSGVYKYHSDEGYAEFLEAQNTPKMGRWVFLKAVKSFPMVLTHDISSHILTIENKAPAGSVWTWQIQREDDSSPGQEVTELTESKIGRRSFVDKASYFDGGKGVRLNQTVVASSLPKGVEPYSFIVDRSLIEKDGKTFLLVKQRLKLPNKDDVEASITFEQQK
mmetsp:Transcript_23231/g.53079  ORF Transcript_23231/g.53079 Transcript_23231/m.53079 type:complete len:171 (-) Transcript_23231:401-913(-)|eukprot:CAMPEP_0113310576 /NCGR_PEP_ID=MMETSP0010_2-20120614/8167_1 /TAXON_ID=216773 ORGANISM="Corethron hystrix, Strain 308" /NCGR_SAMPLE_ID=MMETSP0010_2 /ASSEMBLY_ACC=CAM_ASM_000155 /LENGTH=170 /DNA_ID=CAMNT_0000166061 /DNA_START=147 /DNA_END=659 /DNA_ORIENTATION=- /assembly_acc=CAM_ASM_000155